MIVSIVVDLCSYRMAMINRVEERRDGSLVRWQENQRNSSKCLPGPPSPPFYGEISAYREDTCCGVRIKAKGRKCGGGALVAGEIDKIGILLRSFLLSRKTNPYTSCRFHETTTFTVIFELMKE